MEYFDLSQPLATGMPVYPGSDPARVEQADAVDDGGARVTDLDIDSHTGTHVDAPSHMAPDGESLDAFDPGSFAFEAVRVDCRHLGPREAVAVDDLSAVATDADPDLLAVHTGWDDHWGTEDYRDHPYLSSEAATWCADRGYSVGIDAFSPDPTPPADPDARRPAEPDGYPAHDALLGAGCRIVENLADLGVPPARFTLYAFPLSIPGGDGSPVRALAGVEDR